MNNTTINYLKRVEISGLWQRYDLVWDLNPDVNVLAGINGSGKSTVLNCMWGLLFNESSEGNPHLQMIGTDAKVFFNNGKSISYFHLLGKVGGYRPTDDSVLINIRNQEINVNLINTFDTELKSQEILQKVDEQAKTELDLELWKLQKEYTKYQVRIYKYDSETNRNTHIRFLSMINELFSETQKKVNPDKEELEFLLEDKKINAYQLSSGEKQLLIILLTVLIQDNKPSILFMDEPEISLHIDWQRKLIKNIRELNPNVQIILATHSPAIVMEGWVDKVFEVRDLIVKDCTTCQSH